MLLRGIASIADIIFVKDPADAEGGQWQILMKSNVFIVNKDSFQHASTPVKRKFRQV